MKKKDEGKLTSAPLLGYAGLVGGGYAGAKASERVNRKVLPKHPPGGNAVSLINRVAPGAIVPHGKIRKRIRKHVDPKFTAKHGQQAADVAADRAAQARWKVVADRKMERLHQTASGRSPTRKNPSGNTRIGGGTQIATGADTPMIRVGKDGKKAKPSMGKRLKAKALLKAFKMNKPGAFGIVGAAAGLTAGVAGGLALDKNVNRKLKAKRDTHVTLSGVLQEAHELGELIGATYREFGSKSDELHDRILKGAAGAGAVGMAGAGLGDAIAEDGKFTIRRNKTHFRNQIKQLNKVKANSRARFNGKKLTPEQADRKIAGFTKKLKKAPLKARRMGGGKLGLIIGGLVGAALPPEKRMELARGLIGSAMIEMARRETHKAKTEFTTIQGARFYQFARARETDPFSGLGHDPNVSMARTYGQFKKAKTMAKKAVRGQKRATEIMEDIPALVRDLRGKGAANEGVLRTKGGGEYRIARGNRNSVRVYHKGAPRTRRRKRFYERKSFRDGAAATGIAGGIVAGYKVKGMKDRLMHRVEARGTSVAEELTKAPGRAVAAFRQRSANRSVRRKYGANKTLNAHGGMEPVKNPYNATTKQYDRAAIDKAKEGVRHGTWEKGTRAPSDISKSTNPIRRVKSIDATAMDQIKTRQNMAQAGARKVKATIPKEARDALESKTHAVYDNKVANRGPNLDKAIRKAGGKNFDPHTLPKINKVKVKPKLRALVHQSRVNEGILRKIATIAKRV